MGKLRKYTEFTVTESGFFGSLPFCVFLFLFVYFLGYKDFGLYLFATIACATLFTVLLRGVYYKDRPIALEFTNYIEKIYCSSFPSMHVTRTAVYFSLFTLYFENIVISALFFIIHAVVFWSRYLVKKHYISDLLFGTGSGIVFSILIFTLA